MNFDDDIDLLSGATNKKSAPKQGRRSSGNLLKELSEDNLNLSLSNSPPDVPIRTKRTSVWTEEAGKSAKSKSTNLIEQERFQTDTSAIQSDNDIPEIPDIDDLQDDPLNLPDVKPMVSVDKSTYKELDNQFENLQSGQASFGNLGDIDLSFLTSKLCPEKEVQSSNEVWTMESLFDDLSKIVA